MFLPVCDKDLQERKIEKLHFIMVSGDAYVDHHSFGHSVIARLFESLGYTVGIIAQPTSDADYKKLGTPLLGFLVTSGVVDSMVKNYTVAKIKRTSDSYSPKGKALTPDRALTVYCRNIKRIFPSSAIVIGGIEASLRRFSHYDYWSNSVMPSILVDTKADLLIYGMGEQPVMDICKMLDKGIPLKNIKNIRGTSYSAKESELKKNVKEYIEIQSHEEVASDKIAFCKCFNIQSRNTDYISGKGLLQRCGDMYIVQNPPSNPLSEKQMDEVYDLPFERNYHPMYNSSGGVDAIQEVKFSITSHRGCFGGCSFCALTYHQGRVIQKRSKQSIVEEAIKMTQMPDFKGYIHDVGGPSANFRDVSCDKQKTMGVCQDRYCIGYKKCPALKVSHKEYLDILQSLRKLPKVKKVFVRSGIRFDYIMYDSDEQFFNELVKYHISGQLKIAPEHISNSVLKIMNKPSSDIYKQFAKKYNAANDRYKLKQYLVPYFISSHPGCTISDAIKLTEYLKSINYMPMQVQDFYPTPSTRATCMYYTELDPDSLEKIYVPKTVEEKRMQRALLQYRKKENYHLILKALKLSGRQDLIGFNEKCIIKPLHQKR